MYHSSRPRSGKVILISALLLLGFSSDLAAQQQAPRKSEQNPEKPQQQGPAQDPGSVVRITTQLVQIDAVVLDKKGEHAEDLTENDFELTVDGKRQTLTYFKLVRLPEPKPPVPKGASSSTSSIPPRTMPSKIVAPEDVKRTIAFVIDDLGLSFENTEFARRALRKFVDEQMQDGDLVGIVRTGRGLGALEQFTSDKRILYAAIDKLTWNPNSRDMTPRFRAPAEDNETAQQARDAEDRFDDFRERVISVGTLGSINFVVRGLRELPGRKIAILVSDGFRLFGRDQDNTQVLERVRGLIDLANRSSVVIYSIDAKGLQTLTPTAADDLRGMSGRGLAEQMANVSKANFDSQEGLTFLARETGGFAVLNNNDINFGIQKALRDAQSFYMVGFDPEDEKFDKKYHSIKLKVKRPGLQVRTRAGFLGVADPPKREDIVEQVAGPDARDRQVLSALFSPFGARDLPLQMTSFFFNSERDGSFVRSMFHIDPSKLTFKENPDRPGEKVLKLEIVSFTFNENGAIMDQHGRAFTMNFDQERYQIAMQRGLAYTNDFIIKKPGAYQFRTVLRDPETGKLGSAGQFIQVPDLTKNRLSLSGLVLTAPMDQPETSTEQTSEQQNQQQPPSGDVQPTPAVRRFSRSGTIVYASTTYNPTIDPQTGKPSLTQQLELYHDGKLVYTGPARDVQLDENNPKRPTCLGQLRLSNFPVGDFMMHLVVTDKLAKSKYARADQWMDFSVR